MPIVVEVDAQVKEELKKCGVLHLTFDNWTSVNNVNFIAICAHFINEQFDEMCDRCIILEPYNVSHSAEDMREQLLELLKKFGLQELSGTVLGDSEGLVEPFDHMNTNDDPAGKLL